MPDYVPRAVLEARIVPPASIEGYFAQGLGIDEAGQQGLRDALTESGWGIRIGLETTTPENVQVTDAHCARVFANVT